MVRLVIAGLVVSLWCSTPAAVRAAAQCSGRPLDCATAHIQRQEFAAAIELLGPWLADVPRDVRALNLLGIALTGAGRLDEANARFTAALAVDPDFHPARKNLAVNEFSLGRHEIAAEHFERVLRHVPNDAISHLHLAEIAFARGKPDAALAHFEQARDRVLDRPDWALHYAASLLAAGRQSDAVALLDALTARDASRQFDAGMVLGQRKAYAEAATFFAKARTTYHDRYAAGYNQLLMLVESGDIEGAIKTGEALVAEGKQPAELYNLLAQAYVKAGRVQDAYDALRTATRIDPRSEDNYVDLALIALDHENYDLGLEIVDVGLTQRPASVSLHLQRGVLLAMKGLTGEAEAAFERARTLDPGQVVPHLALAMAWMQTGRTDKAIGLLRERVATRSGNAVLPYMLALALLRAGVDPVAEAGDEVVEALESAVALDPTLASARAELGKILLKRNRVPDAIANLEQAVALDPGNAAPAYVLGQAYLRAGETAKARELLARVSQLNAEERGGDPEREMKRIVLRLVRDGAESKDGRPATR
jgi:tetratricopeptide (TPR) repeat protein